MRQRPQQRGAPAPRPSPAPSSRWTRWRCPPRRRCCCRRPPAAAGPAAAAAGAAPPPQPRRPCGGKRGGDPTQPARSLLLRPLQAAGACRRSGPGTTPPLASGPAPTPMPRPPSPTCGTAPGSAARRPSCWRSCGPPAPPSCRGTPRAGPLHLQGGAGVGGQGQVGAQVRWECAPACGRRAAARARAQTAAAGWPAPAQGRSTPGRTQARAHDGDQLVLAVGVEHHAPPRQPAAGRGRGWGGTGRGEAGLGGGRQAAGAKGLRREAKEGQTARG